MDKTERTNEIDQYFNVNFSAPGFATNLRHVALYFSGPQVVAVQISVSYITKLRPS
jgi:hypothetical protein